MTPLSDSEAATVARFEAGVPAPESWDGGLSVGTDPCKECHPELHRGQCWEGGCVATRDELRETLIDTLRLYGIRGEVLGSLRPQSVADAVLALPEVAALRAKAAAVDRVRECIDGMDPIEVALGGLMYVHGEIRRALDGADRTDRGRC